MARSSDTAPVMRDEVLGRVQPPSTFGNKLFGVVRMGAFWYFAMQIFAPSKPSGGGVLTDNLFSKGENLDFWIFVSETEKFSDFGSEEFLVWHELNVPYAVWTPGSVRHHQITFLPSEAVQKYNASVYAHVYISRSGCSPDPDDPGYDKLATLHATHSLVTHLLEPKVSSHKSLLVNYEPDKHPLTSPEEIHEAPASDGEKWISLWKPNMTINLVDDFTRYPRHGVPATIIEYLNVDENSGNYYPIVYFNEFWLLRDKLISINETARELLLDIELGPISFTRWQLYLQIDQSFQIHRSYGSMIEGEADELKRIFLDGNPVLLAVTMAVSLLHTLFDFLAFKNDIQFWNKNKSMQGLSARSVVMNFICQVIVFLYLLDNETSWMILLSSGVGCCIEIWKVGKAMHIEIDWSRGFPLLNFRDRESYSWNKTKEYDDLAIKYLFYALYPIVAFFAMYSVIYEKHKSWYSWILSSLTSCVYTFGFIMMCPQLFINYKLKSVAHLPWRQMTYKFLNTIIDDLFAFVIKMPWLHRLSVFRDDVIFLIYLYQRWVYPVDKDRINEFGFSEGAEASNVQEGAGSSAPGTTIEERTSGIAAISEGGFKRTGAGLRASAVYTSAADESQSKCNRKDL